MARKGLDAANVARYAANIRAAWQEADAEWLAQGLTWYAEQSLLALALGEKAGLDKRTTIGVVAQLSIDNTWPRNLRAFGVVVDAINGGANILTAPGVHRYTFVREKVASVLAGNDPEWVSDNYGRGSDTYKVKRFFSNLMGDWSVVCIDRWANRIAEANLDSKIGVPSGRDYLEKEKAYQVVAEELGIAPAELQAALWTAVLQERGYVD